MSFCNVIKLNDLSFKLYYHEKELGYSSIAVRLIIKQLADILALKKHLLYGLWQVKLSGRLLNDVTCTNFLI